MAVLVAVDGERSAMRENPHAWLANGTSSSVACLMLAGIQNLAAFLRLVSMKPIVQPRGILPSALACRVNVLLETGRSQSLLRWIVRAKLRIMYFTNLSETKCWNICVRSLAFFWDITFTVPPLLCLQTEERQTISSSSS